MQQFGAHEKVEPAYEEKLRATVGVQNDDDTLTFEDKRLHAAVGIVDEGDNCI